MEEMLALLEEMLPDPVDELEDDLARDRGLVRGPGCDRETWRRVRRRGVDGGGQ